MPPEQDTTMLPNTPSQETPPPYQPTPEEIERTKKIMRDSLAARKPKGFFESIKAWFQ